MIVYAYTWLIVLKRKWGRKTVITETLHKLRECVSIVIITGVSICLHLLHQFPESLQAWQHTMKDQSPATLKSMSYNFKWQDMTPFNLDSGHNQHHKKSGFKLDRQEPFTYTTDIYLVTHAHNHHNYYLFSFVKNILIKPCYSVIGNFLNTT